MPSANLFSQRGFVWIQAALLLLMALTEVGSMVQESQTVDESYHLLAGYQFLKTGRPPVYTEHPPLAQVVAAVPLLPLGLRIPDVQPKVPHDDKRREREFFYGNVRPAEEILMRARAARVVTTLLLGALMAWWMRRHFGVWPALVSLTLFAFDPNFLAHGHYVTNDAPVALTFLWGCLSWNWFLKTGTMRRAMWCGLVLDVAIGTKYNAVLLIPIFVVMYAIHWWLSKGPSRIALHAVRHLVMSLGVMGLVSLAFFFALFGFQTGRILPPDPGSGLQRPLSELLREHPRFGGPLRGILSHPTVARAVDAIVDGIPLPAPDLFRQLYFVSRHATVGHETYLLGRISETGWWYYFPVVLAVKTPAGDLLLLLLAIGTAGALLFRNGGLMVTAKLRKTRFEWFVLAVPPLVYFTVCVLGHINIGVRHLLPMYPFLFMGVGAMLFSREPRMARAVRVAAVAGIVMVAGESAMAYPNYTAFFNAPSGGMRRGADYIVDSNLDWGQDIKRLGKYVSTRGNPPVCLAALSEALPEYYGITIRPFPASLEEARQSGCLLVISLTTLKESNGDGRFDWVLRMTPADRIGGSLLVFDVPKVSQPAGR
jgi:Dolichyl-phosphate-mannose-protein mannosyltransferase